MNELNLLLSIIAAEEDRRILFTEAKINALAGI
jgi:hypothetical protein